MVYSNDAAVEFFHADTPAEREGQTVTDLLHPADREDATGRFERLTTAAVALSEPEFRLRTVDGEIKVAAVVTAPGSHKGRKVARTMAYR